MRRHSPDPVTERPGQREREVCVHVEQPAITYDPARSTTAAPSGTAAEPDGPIPAILPSVTRMSWSRRTSAPEPPNT